MAAQASTLQVKGMLYPPFSLNNIPDSVSSGVMERFGVSITTAALGLSMYVIGCERFSHSNMAAVLTYLQME
jgi:hypothetical protein